MSLSATSMATSSSSKINQIVRLKQVVKKWKAMSMKLRYTTSPDATDTDSDTDTDMEASRPRTRSGFLAVYVGSERERERERFLIPTRYVNLPVFVTLLKRAEEEYGFKFSGGIVVPCEVGFFRKVLEILEKDEGKFGRLELDEFLKMFSEVGLDSSCKTSSCNINTCQDQFTHLMHKAS